MGFPNVIYGDYGDEKVTNSTKIGSLQLGTKMVLPDGRKYRHAKSGGTILVVGAVVRQDGLADTAMYEGIAVAASAAIGANEVSLVLGATTTVANLYEDGYLYISLSAGVGSIYKVKENEAGTASAATVKFTLDDNDTLKLAIVAASSKAGLRANEYGNALVNPAGTAFVGMLLGIPPVEVAASYYFWCQTHGPAIALASGTAAVIGERVSCDSTLAGSVTIASTAKEEENYHIGTALSVGANGIYIIVNLNLE